MHSLALLHTLSFDQSPQMICRRTQRLAQVWVVALMVVALVLKLGCTVVVDTGKLGQLRMCLGL